MEQLMNGLLLAPVEDARDAADVGPALADVKPLDGWLEHPIEKVEEHQRQREIPQPAQDQNGALENRHGAQSK